MKFKIKFIIHIENYYLYYFLIAYFEIKYYAY